MDHIFTPGQCTKAQLYDVVTAALMGAGWQNITSNYAADGDVFYSKGKNGDKALLLNLLPYGKGLGPSAANDTAYSTRTTTNTQWGIRLQRAYIPGSSETPGTFSAPARGFKRLYLASGYDEGSVNIGVNAVWFDGLTFASDAIMNYYIFVDKNKLILFIKSPDTYSKNWVCIYLGIPDTLYAKCDDGRGVIAVSSFDITGNAGYVGMAEYPDASGGITTAGANWYNCAAMGILPTVSPNQNLKYFASELFYQNSSYGIIGKLDGILGISGGNLMSGDTITVNGIQYLIVVIKGATQIYAQSWNWQQYTNNFGCYALAIRVS